MFIAGIFDIWHDKAGDSLYSFSIITFESDEKFKWLHHRTPAVLETQEQIRYWLEYGSIPSDRALKQLTFPKNMVWHQVSNYVNNSRNKAETCNKPIGDEKKETKKSTLWNWLKRKSSDDKDPNEASVSSPKKIKTE